MIHRTFAFALCALFCTVAFVASRNSPPGKDPPPAKNPSEMPLLAVVWLGKDAWYGTFDDNGNFIRDAHSRANNWLGVLKFRRGVICSVVDAHVYEHRSGRAIKGTMIRNGTTIETTHIAFVPEIGSLIRDIKDVNPKDPDRLIWNMPEHSEGFVEARNKKYGDKPSPKAPKPPKAGVPEGYEFIPFSKSHPGKPPRYARAIDDFVEFGHLSDEGDFIPDPDLPAVSRAGIRGGVFHDPFGKPCYYTVLAKPGRPQPDPKPVYEYRSGRLIKGMLHPNGNFVPELGSQVMDFGDYNPDASPTIYNLPGSLKKLP